MWDRRYAEEGFAYGEEPNDFLREVAPRLPAGDVVCLAEGEGRNAVFLAARAGAGRVIAVDQSAVGLEKAAALARARGLALETVVADLADYAPPAGAAVVVSIWAHVPPAIRAPLHARVVEALRPGGALVLEAYTPAQVGRGTGGPPTAESMMTLAALREELRGLELAVGRELVREVREGRYHDGESAVVQVLAFKPGPA
ncbi:MAG: class I SAM-dependent methyltransferase [Sandaracinaceae bacterium]|nr:class I SAM-dependent methyltransferase [Sandaracinaceae bacterium]